MHKLFLGVVVFLLAAASPETPPTPATIQKDIRSNGAKAVVNHLDKSGAYEDIVISKIKSGNAQWIPLAKFLATGTDAATSEELTQALIYALPKSPRAVLSIIDLSGSSISISAGSVCSASFFEGDPTNIPLYRVAAVRSVQSIAIPSLQTAKHECLKHLAKG
jgi:hypothetical protein